jgi:cyclophilin family peptidyl-prolyl cis-trans isomerase
MKNLLIKCLLVVSVFCVNKVTAQSEATFYTSMGVIKIDLTDTLTPITVDSFMARVAEGFYDGLIFHRVIDGFMIQGGDPAGDGTGGVSSYAKKYACYFSHGKTDTASYYRLPVFYKSCQQQSPK